MICLGLYSDSNPNRFSVIKDAAWSFRRRLYLAHNGKNPLTNAETSNRFWNIKIIFNSFRYQLGAAPLLGTSSLHLPNLVAICPNTQIHQNDTRLFFFKSSELVVPSSTHYLSKIYFRFVHLYQWLRSLPRVRFRVPSCAPTLDPYKRELTNWGLKALPSKCWCVRRRSDMHFFVEFLGLLPRDPHILILKWFLCHRRMFLRFICPIYALL